MTLEEHKTLIAEKREKRVADKVNEILKDFGNGRTHQRVDTWPDPFDRDGVATLHHDMEEVSKRLKMVGCKITTQVRHGVLEWHITI